MTLVLEIEYLLGVSYAAIGPESGEPDWPPQPDRIFSALVAAWAAGGAKPEEAAALEWLEAQPVPRLLASKMAPRTSPNVFVPPNDPRSDKQKTARSVLPTLRKRQPRRFPAARPDDPVVRLVWSDADPDEPVIHALERLARDTVYVGHSASLTRCRFILDSGEMFDGPDAAPPLRWVYAGRFAELRQAFEAGRRPTRGASVRSSPPAERSRRNAFSDRWLLLEHVGGSMPDIRASPLVSRAIRDTVLSGYSRIGQGAHVPEEVGGHAPGGRPASIPHLAFVPLPFAGFPYADGHVMGFAIVPPGDGTILDDDDLRRALRAIAPLERDTARRMMTVVSREGVPREASFLVQFALTFEATNRSMEPRLYTQPARVFGTVTPIALDRHLKESGEKREREIEAQIAAACTNIGLPEPERVVVDKHSAFEGAPTARPSGRSPRWMHWRLPGSLASRQLTHAVIRFTVPVDGPMLLGAGRFAGLGLCRPLNKAR